MLKGDDAYFSRQYLLRAIQRIGFWKSYDLTKKRSAVEALNSLSSSDDDLNHWIQTWLTPAQLKKMQSSVRNARARSKGKSITISDDAHKMLSTLAAKHNISFSEVITKYLSRSYKNALKNE